MTHFIQFIQPIGHEASDVRELSLCSGAGILLGIGIIFNGLYFIRKGIGKFVYISLKIYDLVRMMISSFCVICGCLILLRLSSFTIYIIAVFSINNLDVLISFIKFRDQIRLVYKSLSFSAFKIHRFIS